jgi:hypothetical protein
MVLTNEFVDGEQKGGSSEFIIERERERERTEQSRARWGPI